MSLLGYGSFGLQGLLTGPSSSFLFGWNSFSRALPLRVESIFRESSSAVPLFCTLAYPCPFAFDRF